MISKILLEKKIKDRDEDALIINTLETADEKKFHIRLITKSKEQQEKQMSFAFLKNLEKQLLEVKICGIDSIKKVYVRNSQKIEFDKEIDGKGTEEIILETDGTNLAKIFEIDEVDFKRTISNDINEIYQVLGVEAARRAILDELRNVLKRYDIYVNYRHISILCDFMTQRGILTPITRHGLKRNEYGPIRKATFEETVEILLEAGIFAEKDDLKGISENILLGKLTKIGTGSFNLLEDIDILE